MEINSPDLVIICNSDTLNGGFAGDDGPQATFPSVVGYPTSRGIMVGMDPKDCFAGEEAQAKRSNLVLRWPVERGIVSDWDALEQLLHHLFSRELQVAPEEHRILIADAPSSPPELREKMTALLFDTFQVRAVSMHMDAALCLAAEGIETGLVLYSEGQATHVVPVLKGKPIRSSIQSIPLGQQDLTNYMVQLLAELQLSLSSPAERETARDIVEKLCYVAEDFEAETQNFGGSSSIEKTYDMPDGNLCSVGSQRFRCPEILFQPGLSGRDFPGIHALAAQVLLEAAPDLRQQLARNIILAGSNMMCPGIAERLKKELTQLLPSPIEIRVVTPPERKYSAWIGGSLRCRNPHFQDQWITPEEYQQSGPSAIGRLEA